MFRKTLPIFLALLLLSMIGVGVAFSLNAFQKTYPRTKAEKNLTSEMIYYVETNLTNLELIADATEDAMDAAERYLLSGDAATLSDKFDVSWNALREIDLTKGSPTGDFVDRLSASPFEVADVIAMHDSVKSFWEECVSHLTYIELVASKDYYLFDSDKMEILSNYQTIVEESAQIYAYGSNELLLPVTDEDALEEFKYEYLPLLTHIPLNAANWCDDFNILESATDECFNTIENCVQNLAILVGNTSMDNAAMKEALILSYMNVGYTREQAEEAVYLSIEIEKLLEEVREKYKPQEGDDTDTLWWKMMIFVSVDLYDEAIECLEAYYEVISFMDEYAEEYVPAMRLFIQNMEALGIDYGAVVMGYYEPDGINEVLEIGDVIIAVDGKACHNYEEYIDLKGQATGQSYEVEVLRANAQGTLEQMTLQMTMDMPRVTVGSVTSEQYE